MWLQFFSQDAHFTIHLFAALVSLAVGWLYLDAWLPHRSLVGLLRWLGFGLLSLSFIIQATVVEQSALGQLSLSHNLAGVVIVLRLVAYVAIIASQLFDPLQQKPQTHGLELDNGTAAGPPPAPASTTPGVYGAASLSAYWLMPFGGLAIAGLYWRRATVGLERHLKAVAWAFLCLGAADLLHNAILLRSTANPIVYSWVAAFGPLWWAEQICLLGGSIILGAWVWSYLTERFFSQLFMVLVSTTVAVFLAVSIGFTALLLRSSRSDSIANLHTAAQVLDYALSAKQAETAAGAEQLAADRAIMAAVQAKDHKALAALTANYLTQKQQTSLLITDAYGQVLLRGEDPAHWGDSLSGDALIRRGLLGSDSNSVVVQNGVTAPVVATKSSVAIKDGSGTVVGSVTTGLELNQAFVDGIKARTGLDSAVYGGNTVAATTLLAPDNTTTLVGAIQTDPAIKRTVQARNQSYNGTLRFGQRLYLGSVLPLDDVDRVPVGMLAVAQPETAVLLSAGRSVELTFVLTALLMVISILPAYLITKHLVKQLDH